MHARAEDIRTRRPQAKIGQLVNALLLANIATLINSDPQAVQVSQVRVDTAANDTAYTFEINGVTVSITSDASATKDEIADALADAVNADPAIRGQVSAASDGVEDVTLTGLYPGETFTLEDSDANLTSSTLTSAAEAASIGFGLAVLHAGFQSGEANPLGKLAKATAFSYQVETLTVDYAANEKYFVSIKMDGDDHSYSVIVDADTDDATTSAAIFNAINAMMPANTVAATNPSATSVVLTGEVKGKGFVVSLGLDSGTTARLAIAHTVARSPSTSLDLAFAGVSVYTYDEEVTAVEGTTVVYPANAGVKVLQKDAIWVECSESPSFGDAVYVELDAGSANVGKFFATSSATRVKLSRATWQRTARSSSGDNLGVILLA